MEYCKVLQPKVVGIRNLLIARLPVVKNKLWRKTKYSLPNGQVVLPVFFMDIENNDLKGRILKFANLWKKNNAAIRFELSNDPTSPIRVTTTPGDGYHSLIGTDAGFAPTSRPTMNLDSFSMQTSDQEMQRAGTHEFGHAAGFTHEHLAPEVMECLDEQKTILYFLQRYGWDEATTRLNVLTPWKPSNTWEFTLDPHGIMGYSLPKDIFKQDSKFANGFPGGIEITDLDAAMCKVAYPLKTGR